MGTLQKSSLVGRAPNPFPHGDGITQHIHPIRYLEVFCNQGGPHVLYVATRAPKKVFSVILGLG